MREMRKKSRQMDSDWALEVFDKAPFVTVGFVRPDGTPYALPLSLVRKDNVTFYFHCAGEGEKIDCIKFNSIVSLSAVSKCRPVFETEKGNYTEYYNSAIAIGKASFVENREEKTEALRLLCRRFLPKYMSFFDQAVERSLDVTTVVKIVLCEDPVGKCKDMLR